MSLMDKHKVKRQRLDRIFEERNKRKIAEEKLKKKGKKEKNSGENQNRVGFCTRSYPGGKMGRFPPAFLPCF